MIPPAPPPPAANVALYDYANLGAHGENALQQALTKIFASSGVRLNWETFARNKAGRLIGPTNPITAPLSLFIEPKAAASEPLNADGAMAGYSPAGSGRAVVLYDRIMRDAMQNHIAPNGLMPFVAAHELGHALGLGHASRGIMQPHWSPQNISSLRASTAWTPAQRNALLLAVHRLMNPPMSSAAGGNK